nr:MAG TPA: 43 kDa tail protein [Caudoviricetes sp.]
MSSVALKVNGRIYSGWLEVSVRRSLRAASGAFDLNVTERWPGQLAARPIEPGAACEVTIDGQTVITGYVDAVNVSYSAEEHAIAVQGRDKTADLIDCSCDNATFRGLTFGQIARRLVKPFGVEIVEKYVSDLIIRQFVVQTGETVFQTLETAARLAGVLLMSDGEGRLVVTRASLAERIRVPLQSGVNILAGSMEDSAADLFSEISVKSQVTMADMPTFDLTGLQPVATVLTKASAKVKGAVSRYRPLRILAESQADATYCRQRARWEAANRLAASRVVNLTVQGWLDGDGNVWAPNRLVTVSDDCLKIGNDLLITDVALRLSENGSVTELRLVDPQAYEPQPVLVNKVPASYARYNL